MTDTKHRRKRERVKVTVEEARDGMKDLLNRAQFGGERVVITRHGKDAVAVVPLEDLAKIEAA